MPDKRIKLGGGGGGGVGGILATTPRQPSYYFYAPLKREWLSGVFSLNPQDIQFHYLA